MKSSLILRVMVVLTVLAMLPGVGCLIYVALTMFLLMSTDSAYAVLFLIPILAMSSTSIEAVLIAFFHNQHVDILAYGGLFVIISILTLVSFVAAMVVFVDFVYDFRADLGTLLFVLGCMAITGWYLVLLQQLGLWSKRLDAGVTHLCRGCGYHLRGTIEAGIGACPECGRGIPMKQIEAYQAMHLNQTT